MNNEDVINELKKRIAISNFTNEPKKKLNLLPIFFNEWSDKFMNKRKILNAITVLSLIIILIGTGTIIYAKKQWNVQFENYLNREYEIASTTLKEAYNSGYAENIEMDYIFQDEIGVKINSLLMTDNYLETNLQFEFPENLQLNTKTFTFGYAIYDENNNIYAITFRPHWGNPVKHFFYPENLCKELSIDFPAEYLSDASGIDNIEANKPIIISKLHLSSTIGFPKSQKLYIRIFDLGYHMQETIDDSTLKNEYEDFCISNSEWIFEIEVPEKFYERKLKLLKLENDIPDLNIDKITLNEVNLTIEAVINNLSETIDDIDLRNQADFRNSLINITDETGKIYFEKTNGLSFQKDLIRMQFEINKNIFDNHQLYLNFNYNGNQYSSKLISK